MKDLRDWDCILNEKKIKIFEKEIKDLSQFEERIKIIYIKLRMNLIIEDMYGEDIICIYSIQTIMIKSEKLIHDKFYSTNYQILLKGLKDYEKSQSKVNFLSHFHRHCLNNEEFAIHPCQGKLIQISSNYFLGEGLNKNESVERKYFNNITHVICEGCK